MSPSAELPVDPESTGDPELWVANEFASCRLRRVSVGNGYRIQVHSERRNATVSLDAMALDALTRLSPEQISHLMTLVTEPGPPEPRRQDS